MPDIFVSYSHQDAARARQLSECLGRKGWSVWLDQRLVAGEIWDDAIETNLENARAIVVLWSTASVKSRWVKREAHFGQERGILVPVQLDEVKTPFEFSDLHSSYLDRWDGSESDPRFVSVVEGIERVLDIGRPREVNVSPLVSAERRALVAPAQATLSELAVFRDVSQSWCPVMVVMPQGEFMMGAPDSDADAYPDEKPRHRVRIAARFALGQHPVTFAEYDVFAKATGREYPADSTWGRARRPVINVIREDATAYAEWLSQQTGADYRLPSEAEWEYACRAGTTTRYATGDTLSTDLANYGGRIGRTTVVGKYPANAWMLYDMHGNVCEWMEDVWHDTYDGAPSNGSPWLDGTDPDLAVIRGGCWSDYERTVRTSVRGKEPARQRYNFVGFRVARSLT